MTLYNLIVNIHRLGLTRLANWMADRYFPLHEPTNVPCTGLDYNCNWNLHVTMDPDLTSDHDEDGDGFTTAYMASSVPEPYDDPVPAPPDTAADAPFAGVPYLIKDVGLHFGGLKCEFCSRLCEGMTAPEDSHYGGLVRRGGVSR